MESRWVGAILKALFKKWTLVKIRYPCTSSSAHRTRSTDTRTIQASLSNPAAPLDKDWHSLGTRQRLQYILDLFDSNKEHCEPLSQVGSFSHPGEHLPFGHLPVSWSHASPPSQWQLKFNPWKSRVAWFRGCEISYITIVSDWVSLYSEFSWTPPTLNYARLWFLPLRTVIEPLRRFASFNAFQSLETVSTKVDLRF